MRTIPMDSAKNDVTSCEGASPTKTDSLNSFSTSSLPIVESDLSPWICQYHIDHRIFNMSDSTFHVTREDLRKAESKVSQNNDGNVPPESEPAQMKVMIP